MMHRSIIRPLNILRGKSLYDRENRNGYLFVLPCIIFFSVTLFWPLGYGLYMTFNKLNFNGTFSFIGLQAYSAVLHDRQFWISLKNTLYLLVCSVPPTLILSLAAALLFTSLANGMVRSAFRAVYFLPVITSSVAVAFVWSWLFMPQNGLINEVLRLVGIRPQAWLFDTKEVIPSLAIMTVWMRLGFDMIIFIAGLQAIPEEFYEAAKLDGAGPLARFRHITLPLLNPQIVLVTIFEVMTSLKAFDLPYVATQGGPVNASRVVVFHIYDLAFRWNRMSEAVVAAVFLFLLIMAVTIIQWRMLRRPVEY
jgi:multiple sugar transport system permease protein